MSRPTIRITPKTFNADKLVVSDIKEIKTKQGIKMEISEISYLNDNDERCDLYIQLPTVDTYGPYPQYKYNFSPTSKTLKDIVGYTISYSNEEVNNLFKKITKKCSTELKILKIKPVFNNIDVAYFKIKMNGDDNKMLTEFYSDKKCSKTINGLEIVQKPGSITPMIHLKSIYHDAHGATDYKASFQINIVKAIFKKRALNIPEFDLDDTEEEEEEQ